MECCISGVDQQMSSFFSPLNITLSKKSKSNLSYTRGITPKRVTSGDANLRGLAPGQHNPEETLQRWEAVGDVVLYFTGLGIEPETCRTHSDVVNN